ncbi:hypothetical protein FQN52_009314 [Onygenales sp. PD_12]|nr:hypothetical protein FQN52_009314 [Onygenales sp. PD_12]KAK2791331.1 hypothetical protein FQN51_002241 [Onygenales sp. PD_10]
MFGAIPTNRACLTEAVPIQSDPNTPATNFVFTFPAAPKFSYIVVFQLPGTTLPPDTAAAVYIQLPPNLLLGPNNANTTPPSAPEFKFLGAIANEKPSAIFKINYPSPRRTEAEEEDEMMDVASASGITTPMPSDADINPNAMITLGISIEPAQSVAAKLAQKQSQSHPSTTELVKLARPTPQVTTKVLAQRIIGNAFNFLASFAASDPRTPGGDEVVPLKAFRDWWTKFERRIDADPGFLERAEGV